MFHSQEVAAAPYLSPCSTEMEADVARLGKQDSSLHQKLLLPCSLPRPETRSCWQVSHRALASKLHLNCLLLCSKNTKGVHSSLADWIYVHSHLFILSTDKTLLIGAVMVWKQSKLSELLDRQNGLNLLSCRTFEGRPLIKFKIKMKKKKEISPSLTECGTRCMLPFSSCKIQV